MAEVSIRLAETSEDFENARALCSAWLDWHWKNYPDDWPMGPDHPMDPENFQKVVDELPTHHARPGGGILVAYLSGEPAGCVMYHKATADMAEFKRMFVAENGRGHGLGRQLLDRMFEQMIADGYRKVFFSSASFLTHARAMYEKAGFIPMPHPDGFPDDWRKRVYFMQRELC